jgi:hypothetical protein
VQGALDFARTIGICTGDHGNGHRSRQREARLIGALPRAVRPFASLMRLDRPIGVWLLFWPCAWSVALAGLGEGAGG